jgi:hypothetical protein
MEKTALSVFAQLGQKLKEDYYGLIFNFTTQDGFGFMGTEVGVTLRFDAKNCDATVQVLRNDNCKITMVNSFDANTGEPSPSDWLAFAEDCLHKYNTADHRAILRKIAAESAQRASENDNTYREATARLTDIENQSK